MAGWHHNTVTAAPPDMVVDPQAVSSIDTPVTQTVDPQLGVTAPALSMQLVTTEQTDTTAGQLGASVNGLSARKPGPPPVGNPPASKSTYCAAPAPSGGCVANIQVAGKAITCRIGAAIPAYSSLLGRFTAGDFE